MTRTPRRLPFALAAVLGPVLVVASIAATGGAAAAATSAPSVAASPAGSGAGPVRIAQADNQAGIEGEAPRELQPRYEPVPPAEPDAFNDEYVFGLTRGIADSALHPVAKIVLFPITVPLDIALLPFEVIGGFF